MPKGTVRPVMAAGLAPLLSAKARCRIRIEPTEDRDHIQAANDGDPAGFEALYHRYRDWVLNLAYRFTHDHDDALDVLQETFAYLLKKFPGFELRARMTTFLYPVVKHLSIAMQQRKRRFVNDEQLYADLPAPPPPTSPDDSRAELAQALTVLPAAQREVLLMRFIDAMTLEEISTALEIPTGTAKSRLHRALTTLRQNSAARKYFLD